VQRSKTQWALGGKYVLWTCGGFSLKLIKHIKFQKLVLYLALMSSFLTCNFILKIYYAILKTFEKNIRENTTNAYVRSTYHSAQERKH
jgi:hypothetical protein